MPDIPSRRTFDDTLTLLSQGYGFISEQCDRLRSDAFRTRLMLRTVVCMRGPDASRVFYEPDRFTRRGAMPQTTFRLLQDKGSVQALDGKAHRRRKRMFMDLMDEAAIGRLVQRFREEWLARVPQWATRREVVLHDEIRDILCRAVCAWAGVPLGDAEAPQRTREFGAMIDASGSIGPRNWRAQLLRNRNESWIRAVVRQVREGVLTAPPGSAADVFLRYRESDGTPLTDEVAAVELINVLRPTVAVARFIVFGALALHEHPQCREQVAAGDEDYLTWFVQEVRRYYPFFPFIAGRVMQPFEWRQHRFSAGDWVVLDLYGTNHDSRTFEDPDRFRPERFRSRDPDPFDFVPQGGGDFIANHRCPGEWITIALMKEAMRILTRDISYEVPEQDLTVSPARMPALPASGFRIAQPRSRAPT